MSAETDRFDLARDVPTTAEDVCVLRRLRAETPGWLSLTAAELLAILPADALDHRPTTSAAARPFVLDPEDAAG